jgi:hypothetical protein
MNTTRHMLRSYPSKHPPFSLLPPAQLPIPNEAMQEKTSQPVTCFISGDWRWPS